MLSKHTYRKSVANESVIKRTAVLEAVLPTKSHRSQFNSAVKYFQIGHEDRRTTVATHARGQKRKSSGLSLLDPPALRKIRGYDIYLRKLPKSGDGRIDSSGEKQTFDAAWKAMLPGEKADYFAKADAENDRRGKVKEDDLVDYSIRFAIPNQPINGKRPV